MPSSFKQFLTNARKSVSFLLPKPISHLATKEQDALLLSRLPPELRRMIWKTYIGTHAVHVYPGGGTVRAEECLKLDGDAEYGAHFDLCSREKIRCDYVSLLLTCKKMYISCLVYLRPFADRHISYFECIHLLYGETLFDFSHGAYSLVLLPYRLPATNLALISRVNLTWEVYHPLRLEKKKKDYKRQEVLWVGIWKSLAAMEGLKWLRVELKLALGWEASLWTDLEWTLWEDVKKVTRPSHFELILPFPAASSTRQETLPCTIRRVEDLSCMERLRN